MNPGFIPPDVAELMDRIHMCGFGVWLVGGAVRDFLLGLTPKDYDIATDAAPQEILGMFDRVVPIGLRHGTIQVRTSHRGVEVTSVDPSGLEGLLKDLGRRDFTFNALALSYPGGELIDPHEGEKDLHIGILRAVGDAGARFREDPLRVLRASRFISTYGFKIQKSTFLALKAEADGLRAVAGERIREEIFGILLGGRAPDALACLIQGGALGVLLPEIPYFDAQGERDQKGVRDHWRTLLRIHLTPARVRVRLAALLRDAKGITATQIPTGPPGLFNPPESIASSAMQVMTRWRMSNRDIRDVCTLIENQLSEGSRNWSDAALRRLISKVGPDLVEDLLELAYAEWISSAGKEASLHHLYRLQFRIYEQLRLKFPLRVEELALTGEDIMATLGIRPGPLVGKLLRRLYELVLEDPTLNDRKILMDFMRKEYHIDG